MTLGDAILSTQRRPQPPGEFSPVCGLTIVVVGDTPAIAAAVVDSLPDELPYFLVGPRDIAFLRHSIRCREYFVNDLSLEERNKTDFVRTIERLDSADSNIFLIPVDDSANRIVYSTFDRLGTSSFPMPDSSSFETLNDKWQFHRLCSELGVRVPKTIRLNDKAEIDFEYLRATVGLPFVLKPTNKSDSLGVQVIRSKENLRKEILSCRKYNFSPLIAQSFIPGIDIDISALVDRGHIKKFAIQTRKKDNLCFVQNEELVKLAEVIVRDLCYTGVIHIDARLHDTSDEIFLIEANPRFWGSLAEATSGGLNFVRAGIYISMGLESPDPATISDVNVPSTRRILAEIVTFKRSYLRMGPLERLRLQRGVRIYIRNALNLL
jgi:predicted ATP-grasp superfamily ATP-dependent carboligase